MLDKRKYVVYTVITVKIYLIRHAMRSVTTQYRKVPKYIENVIYVEQMNLYKIIIIPM